MDGEDCAKTMTQLEQDGSDDNPLLVGKLHRKILLINAECNILKVPVFFFSLMILICLTYSFSKRLS